LGRVRDDGRWTSSPTIGLLDELLMHTIAMRDLYKSARCRTDEVNFRHLRLLFDAHYKGQSQLVDVLVDRLRALGGADRISASVFLQGKPPSYTLRGRLTPARLLSDLLDAHDSVLNTAYSAGLNGQETGQSSARDCAVEQVALLNDRHSRTVREQFVRLDRQRHGHDTSEQGVAG
jgi:starvation-inducible DNA-binding protein